MCGWVDGRVGGWGGGTVTAFGDLLLQILMMKVPVGDLGKNMMESGGKEIDDKTKVKTINKN